MVTDGPTRCVLGCRQRDMNLVPPFFGVSPRASSGLRGTLRARVLLDDERASTRGDVEKLLGSTQNPARYVTQSTMTPPVRLATVPVIAAPRSEATNTATSASSARVVARLRWLFPAMVAANSCTVMPYALACSP
jgi:hypothetical protein